MTNRISAWNQIWKDSYIKFIVLFVALYLLFNYFNIFYIGITAKGGFYSSFLDENLNYIKWWRTFYLETSAQILRWFGHNVLTNETQLRVIGRSGFTLVYSCLGYGILSVFVAFCISFPSPFKHRIGFMLMGIIIIQLLNILRFILLSLYWKGRKPFGMDHHDVFNISIYLVLIMMCYLWLRYSSKDKNAQNAT